MEEKKLVPKRRFRGFEEEWKQQPLKELRDEEDRYSFTGGPFGSDLKSSDYTHTGIRIIQLQNIGDGYFNNDHKIYTSQTKAESLESCMIFPDDIILAKMAEPLARATIIPNNEHKYLMASDGIRLKIDKEKYHNYFVLTVINNDNFRNKAYENSTGTTRKRIGLVTLGNLTLFIPEYKEQQKIGEFFKVLDERIANQERKIAKVKALKEAYLTEMFPQEGETVPKRRFKGFEGEWVKKQFKEIADIVRGASPRPIEDPKWFNKNSSVGWLRISDVTSQNGRIRHLEQRLSDIGLQKTRVLYNPHLLLSIAATVGKPVINYVKTGVHDGFLIFQNPKFNLEYMYQWLEMFRGNWKKYGQPGSQVNLNSDIIKEHFLLLPSYKEQQKIGSFFKNLDDQIRAEEAKLEKFKKMKEAYLEEMFV